MIEFVLPKITKRLIIYRIILVFLLLCWAAWLFIPHFSFKNKAILLLFTLGIVFCVYLSVYFKNYKVLLSGKTLTVKSGVLFSKEKILCDTAKLYCMSFSLPLDKRFGLMGIVFFAVKGALIILPLKKEDIEKIKESFA